MFYLISVEKRALILAEEVASSLQFPLDYCIWGRRNNRRLRGIGLAASSDCITTSLTCYLIHRSIEVIYVEKQHFDLVAQRQGYMEGI